MFVPSPSYTFEVVDPTPTSFFYPRTIVRNNHLPTPTQVQLDNILNIPTQEHEFNTFVFQHQQKPANLSLTLRWIFFHHFLFQQMMFSHSRNVWFLLVFRFLPTNHLVKTHDRPPRLGSQTKSGFRSRIRAPIWVSGCDFPTRRWVGNVVDPQTAPFRFPRWKVSVKMRVREIQVLYLKQKLEGRGSTVGKDSSFCLTKKHKMEQLW